MFDVQLLLKLRTQTTTYYTGETVTNVTVEDITEQDDVLLKSVEFNMNHTSVIDAYNKCPNHSGLDFTITADLNSVAAAVKLDAQKEFVNGTLAGDDFDFQLYDLQAPVKLYFAKGDADMHIADPDNGNLVRVYQLNIPSQSSWGEGIDGWEFYNALVERYSWNDATSGLIQSPGDVGDLFEGYLNGDDMSPHMSEEQLKKLIYSFAVQPFSGDVIGNDLRINRCLKDCAGIFQLFSEFMGIDQVSIVCQPQCALDVIEYQRLCIFSDTAPRGRIPDMSHSDIPGQFLQFLCPKHFIDKSHPFTCC